MSTTTVRITDAVAADWASREIFTEYAVAGEHVVPTPVAESMRSDAEYYSEPDGPGYSLTVGQRSAYRTLARKLAAAGVALPVVENVDGDRCAECGWIPNPPPGRKPNLYPSHRGDGSTVCGICHDRGK